MYRKPGAAALKKVVYKDINIEEANRYQAFEPETFGSSSERRLLEGVLKGPRQRQSLKPSS
ncbi:hypothetical protein RBB78_04760 [Tunturiibacter empetritectus]|uniref:hypothetical protein n=1 Tax=Tunturiibacter empetritectus TaxID=3069691 RepID=UPI003D9AD35D